MKNRTFLVVLIGFIGLNAAPVHAEPGYLSNMKNDFVRGTKNILSCPAEIPIAVQKAHESAGYPVVRHMAGFTIGAFKAIERGGSGIWDWIVMAVPGAQEGVPPTPKTLF